MSRQCRSKVKLIQLGSAHEKYGVRTRPKPLKPQTTPPAKNPYIKEIGRGDKIFYLVPNKLIYFILALAKSIYYSKCVNIATYPIIVIITHYYRSYFSSYSVALPRHNIKFKFNRPGSMLTSVFQG